MVGRSVIFPGDMVRSRFLHGSYAYPRTALGGIPIDFFRGMVLARLEQRGFGTLAMTFTTFYVLDASSCRSGWVTQGSIELL